MNSRVKDCAVDRANFIFFTVVLIVVLLIDTSIAPGDESADVSGAVSIRPHRWSLEEYSVHAQQLREAVSNVHAKFTATETRSDTQRTKKEVGEYFVKGSKKQEAVRLTQRFDGSPGPDQTTVTNLTPDCLFEVRAAKDDANYAISFFDDGADKSARRKFEANARVSIDSFIGAAFLIYGTPAERLIDGADNIEIQPISRDDGELIELSCEPSATFGYGSLRIRFNPAMHDAITEYVAERRPRGGTRVTESGAVTCRQLSNGIVVPVQVARRVKNSANDIEVVEDVEIDYVSFGDVPDKQFELAAFGLPNVTVHPVPRRWYPIDRWYFWLLIVVAVAGGVYLRKRKAQAA